MIPTENTCIQFSEIECMKSIMDSVTKFIDLCANDFNHCQFGIVKNNRGQSI